MALGKFEKIDLRTQWQDEAREFTPWLAKEENIEELSNIIGIDLEIEGTEILIGNYKADIVAKDISNNKNVIIENQLEKTNHDHLGKIITYASGINASIRIWISKKITEEHRKAVDWLNENTGEDLSFFGIEIELWKINDSLPAPRFNIVCRPNEWSKRSKNIAKNKNLSETKSLQLEFWNYLNNYFNEHSTNLTLRTPGPKHWYSISIGRSKFNISLTVNTVRKRIGCELYIRGEKAKKAFAQLEEQKNQIETELGINLNWEALPEGQDSRIILYEKGDLNNRSDWDDMVPWFKEWAEGFYNVFSPKVKNLKI